MCVGCGGVGVCRVWGCEGVRGVGCWAVKCGVCRV